MVPDRGALALRLGVVDKATASTASLICSCNSIELKIFEFVTLTSAAASAAYVFA